MTDRAVTILLRLVSLSNQPSEDEANSLGEGVRECTDSVLGQRIPTIVAITEPLKLTGLLMRRRWARSISSPAFSTKSKGKSGLHQMNQNDYGC